MKHNATLLIAAFSMICANNVIHGMEKDNKPDIYCEEDIAIVLRFEYKKDNNGSTQHCYMHKTSPTHILHNPINHQTKINTISFDDHMENINGIFKQASNEIDECTKKQIAYEISAYLIASHSKHVHRNDDNLALPTLKYFENAQKQIGKFFYNHFKTNNDKTDYNFYNRKNHINLAKIFYKPSYTNNDQREQNDIELITDGENAKIKICDNASIETRFTSLTLNIPNSITIKRNIHPMASEEIKKDDTVIMGIYGYCNSIILMDV
jgi:hypothetical protein